MSMCLLFTKYMTPGNWLSQCHCWIWAINPACNRNRLKSLVEWHCKARSWRLPLLQEVGGIQNSNLMSRKSIAFEFAPKSLTWCNVSDSLRKNGAEVHQWTSVQLSSFVSKPFTIVWAQHYAKKASLVIIAFDLRSILHILRLQTAICGQYARQH